jgi:hypothetical protein
MGAAVSRLAQALSWSGKDVTMSLFVVAHGDPAPAVQPPSDSTRPLRTRQYRLVDDAARLDGRSVCEIDLVFDEVPVDLEGVVRGWLRAAVAAGGIVAWFGFEGSFDFEHVLTDDTASQVFAFADRQSEHLAIDDRYRDSQAWAAEVTRARIALFAMVGDGSD